MSGLTATDIPPRTDAPFILGLRAQGSGLEMVKVLVALRGLASGSRATHPAGPSPAHGVPLVPQILMTKAENTRLLLQIDNAKLAADDFRTK